mmetsp:Transcript_51622/g.120849  ORF Transcript_51622/g.120849 Transcript_51622/m.120849 type:complete len:203 (-) Transcript_51622:190-798(-)
MFSNSIDHLYTAPLQRRREPATGTTHSISRKSPTFVTISEKSPLTWNSFWKSAEGCHAKGGFLRPGLGLSGPCGKTTGCEASEGVASGDSGGSSLAGNSICCRGAGAHASNLDGCVVVAWRMDLRCGGVLMSGGWSNTCAICRFSRSCSCNARSLRVSDSVNREISCSRESFALPPPELGEAGDAQDACGCSPVPLAALGAT